MSNKAKINVIGQIFGTGGYASHTRNLANALNEEISVKLMCQLPQGWNTVVNDKELEMIKREDADTNLIIAMPQNWKIYANNKINIGFLVWEGDKIPESWLEECMNPNINYIFVPSEHTKKAILNTLDALSPLDDELINKIYIMPHGVSDIFKPNTKEVNRVHQKVESPNLFRFFANKGFTNLEDRGGIQYLLKAYNEEFKKEEKVELLVKINPAYGIPDMDKLLKEIGYTKDSPKLKIMVNEISYDKLPDLYNNCDVFVSPTRAEAFNLPCIESLACGKPVITTNFGGQAEYINELNGFLIGGELEEVEHDIIYEGIRWLTPDIKELRKVMRFCYDNPKKLEDMRSECLKTAKTYTWEATSKKIADLLK